MGPVAGWHLMGLLHWDVGNHLWVKKSFAKFRECHMTNRDRRLAETVAW